MDRITERNGLSFVWNEDKALSNVLDHGITFEEAMAVLFDPFLRLVDASREEEARDAAIGIDEKCRILYVVHIEQESEVIRLISARPATQNECEFYDS